MVVFESCTDVVISTLIDTTLIWGWNLVEMKLLCDHTSLLQMPEIVLFDMFESRSGDGMSMAVFYPSRIVGMVVLHQELF